LASRWLRIVIAMLTMDHIRVLPSATRRMTRVHAAVFFHSSSVISATPPSSNKYCATSSLSTASPS